MKTEQKSTRSQIYLERTVKYIMVLLLATSTYSCTLFREISIFQLHKNRVQSRNKNLVKDENIFESTVNSKNETGPDKTEKSAAQQSYVKNKKTLVSENSAKSKAPSEIASEKPSALKLKKGTDRLLNRPKRKSSRIHIKELIVFDNITDDSFDNIPDDKTVQNYYITKFYSEYSKKLGIVLNGTENIQLIMAVDEWLGTPFKWGGCSKYGIDCSCLVQSIYKNVYGIKLNRTTVGMFTDELIPVDKENLKEGDLIFFKIRNNRISHVGIYLKDNKFVHSTLTKGVMINDLDQNYYRKRFLAAGRVTDNLNHMAKLSYHFENKQEPNIASINQIGQSKSKIQMQNTRNNSIEWLKRSITHHKNFGGLSYASSTLYSQIN